MNHDQKKKVDSSITNVEFTIKIGDLLGCESTCLGILIDKPWDLGVAENGLYTSLQRLFVYIVTDDRPKDSGVP